MLIQSSNIYEILGVDRNADTKTIKKAYAKLVKQYHPEEHPEEWKNFFSRRNLLPITSQREFLMGMGDCLAGQRNGRGQICERPT